MSKIGKKHRSVLGMMLLSVVFFATFHYLPMAGLIIAFQDYSVAAGFRGSDWVGFRNFEILFSRGEFPQVVWNTVLISLLRIVVGFAAPLIFALMLNEMRLSFYRRTVQSLTAMPHYISWVALGGMFIVMLTNDGPVNSVIASVGLKKIPFLTEGYWFLFSLVLTGVWQSFGYGAVIYLAAISAISPTLYEAADIDGANRLQKAMYITLPALLPTIITLLLLSLASILNAGFDQVYNMYNPSVYHVSDIIDTYVLRRVQTMEFSLGATAGLFKSLVGMALIVVVNTVVRKMSHGSHGVY